MKLNSDTTTIDYYADGHIESISIQNPGKNKLKLEFDKEGGLKKYENYKENDFYTRLFFFPSGNIEQKLSLRRGKFDGTCLTFYEKGNVESFRFVNQGKDTLFGVDYYDIPLLKAKSAVYFNDSGHIFYKEHFDINGNIVKTEGTRNK